MPDAATHDVIIVGAGAAGLATAIFARRLGRASVHVVDGAARPGAKILVSGGSRCNVTNAVVTDKDYWGGRRTIIRRVLARLPVNRTIAFFEEIGVPLKEEPTGKLFPRSDRSRDVLEALLRAARALEVTVSPGVRVHEVRRDGRALRLATSRGPMRAAVIVLATGGLSLPKTGSDGAGLLMARALGHSIVPTTPALAPLVLHGSFNQAVSGVALDVELALRVEGRITERIRGPLLWTHFGVSGPAALDMSRHWLRTRLQSREAAVTANLSPGESFEEADARRASVARSRPRVSLQSALGEQLPASLASALIAHVGASGDTRLSDLSRETRRAISRVTTELPLPITDSRGYNFAEATAGGIALEEIDPSTMRSRVCPGLVLVGEMLDVDGRLGGFNFQWAWASGRAAAEGLAAQHAGRA